MYACARETRRRLFAVHDLRHTCATLLLSKNVNPKVVSEMLGHATIAIILDTYSHVLPNMQSEAAKAMEDTLT
jgi:integrase